MSKSLIYKMRCGCEFWEGLDYVGEVYSEMQYCAKHDNFPKLRSRIAELEEFKSAYYSLEKDNNKLRDIIINLEEELAQLRERAEILKRWADIAIEMINELRMDYVPGELGDLDGIKAIRKLRADNARLQKAVDVLAETLKETLGKLDEYKGDDDGYVIEHGYVVLKEYRSGKEQK
jgi:vacuolar-type H+-ATPase subunit I/STV1